MKKKESVIIVAGGKGLRMGGDIPKQFVEVEGLPILMHTIQAFYAYNNEIQIMLVLPESHILFWNELCDKYNFKIKHQITTGGENRFDSVKNGLEYLDSCDIVAVQDGVRPFATKELIKRCFDEASKHKAVIPVTRSRDSLRQLKKKQISKIINRDKIVYIQTPQVFDYNLLSKAYKQEFKPHYTDDASVVEEFGHKIHLVEGEDTNIKVTTPIDLLLSKAILQTRKNEENND